MDIFNWTFGVALGLGGYFIRDLHSDYKAHVKESDDRENRLVILETVVPRIDRRLDNIESLLAEALRKES